MRLTDTWPYGAADIPRQKNFGYWEFLVYLVMTLGYRIYWDWTYTGRGYGDEVYILYQAENFLRVFVAFAYCYLSAYLFLCLETKDRGYRSRSGVPHRICAAAMLVSALCAPVVFITSAVFAPSMAVPDLYAFVAIIVVSLIALRNGVLVWRRTMVPSVGEGERA